MSYPSSANKNSLYLATAIILASLLLATLSPAFAQELPTEIELTTEQQSTLDKREDSDEELSEAEKEALEDEQKNDLADNTACDDEGYQSSISIQGSSSYDPSGNRSTEVFENGRVRGLIENIDFNLKEVGETLGEIDESTGKTQRITKYVCDYLKAIKRISKNFEDKTFLEDPAARRTAARDTEKYKFQVLNLVKKGHITGVSETGTETTGKMFPENTQEYINQAMEEKVMVQLDAYQKIADENPDNPNLKNTINSLRYQESRNLESKLKNSLTQDKIDQAFDSSSNLSAQESDDIFLTIFNPESNGNPYTQMMTMDSALQQAKYDAERNVREELLAGNGFLNNRECAEITSGTGDDNAIYCSRWVTITPGSIISGGALAVINSRLSQYEQADSEGELTSYLPSVKEITNMSAEPDDDDNTSGGYGRFEDYDGDGEANWTDPDDDGDGVPDTEDLTHFLNDGARRKVGVKFQASTPTAVTGTSFFTSTLSWTSSSTYCVADNNWKSADLTTAGVITPVKSAGEQLAESGSAEVRLPLNFEAKLVRVRGGSTAEYLAATSSDTTRLGMLATLTVPTGSDGTAAGDIFRLSIKPFDAANTVEVTVPATATGTTAVINLLKNALVGKMKNFTFGYQTFNGKITVLAEPFYQLSCVNTSGSQTSTTTKKVKVQK